ncbi:class I SAM-dependent methyltransferase [Bacillus sp. 31A1R]|uniref:Class I SAM-dependent methyltransferase n=1 Tax=Robertmurraya mangrovi TaxID=3098077 RepID=A0ABU5IWF9_9BACI|nr:class I SAM-dependent methyltransferase [Bacillus sp. 31A1R]MDZ5471499.1 class I SAM-dependent methyltransferase [Bacillus sp. 31A1R]
MKETILNYENLKEMLDSFLREPTMFWDNFYSDRERNIPFFANKPDENLVAYIKNNIIQTGRVLELGCGPGRNAIFLAEQGSKVDAVDISSESLQWGMERARDKQLEINFIEENIFNLEISESTYDFVYDSGCFHHIAPHRRMDYIELVMRALKSGGHFAITCFVQGGELGGAEISDWEVYRKKSLMGGLGFTEEKLRLIFNEFEEIEIRKMRDSLDSGNVFGNSSLWAALFRKK